MTKHRIGIAIGLLSLFVVSFSLGAVWIYKRAFPYEYLTQSDWLVKFKRNTIGSVTPKKSVETAFADITLDSFPFAGNVDTRVEKGGIAAIGNDVIVLDSRGKFYLYSSNDGKKDLRKLHFEGDNGFDSVRSYSEINDLSIEKVDRYFNFFDLLPIESLDGLSLIVSHLHWHQDQSCFTMRASQLDLPKSLRLAESSSSDNWQVLYDSKPCLMLEEGHLGEGTGGRLAMADDKSFLLTVGSMDGRRDRSEIPHSQDPKVDYGKLVRVNLSTLESEHVSSGHRNMQGLVIDSGGNIWTTEHGPQGGDELNLIEEGANYGYPEVTYGTNYGKKTWWKSEIQGSHAGFQRPIFSWVPSIGVSNLIQVENSLPAWEGDLLVTSLRERSIFRMRYRDGRMVFSEPIPIGARIRDLDQLQNGTIILWTDDHVISEINLMSDSTPAADFDNVMAGLSDAKRGEAEQTLESCLQCHSITKDGVDRAGPSLWGIANREIASTGYSGYSESLNQRNGVWDQESISDFLESPSSFAPGTTMAAPGISDPQIREAIVNYLETLQ